jgi:hypothetical protein
VSVRLINTKISPFARHISNKLSARLPPSGTAMCGIKRNRK